MVLQNYFEVLSIYFFCLSMRSDFQSFIYCNLNFFYFEIGEKFRKKNNFYEDFDRNMVFDFATQTLQNN